MTERNIQQRYDTAANFKTSNRVLLAGEKAIESDTLKEKVGDGSTHYNDLPYTGDSGKTASNYFEITDFNSIDFTKNGVTINGVILNLSDFSEVPANAADLLTQMVAWYQEAKETQPLLEHLLFSTDGVSKFTITYDKTGEIGNGIELTSNGGDKNSPSVILLSNGTATDVLKGGANSLEVDVRGRRAAGKIVFAENPAAGDYLYFSVDYGGTETGFQFVVNDGDQDIGYFPVIIGGELADSIDNLIAAYDEHGQGAVKLTRNGDDTLQIEYLETGTQGNITFVTQQSFQAAPYISPALSEGENSLADDILTAINAATNAANFAQTAYSTALSAQTIATNAQTAANLATGTTAAFRAYNAAWLNIKPQIILSAKTLNSQGMIASLNSYGAKILNFSQNTVGFRPATDLPQINGSYKPAIYFGAGQKFLSSPAWNGNGSEFGETDNALVTGLSFAFVFVPAVVNQPNANIYRDGSKFSIGYNAAGDKLAYTSTLGATYTLEHPTVLAAFTPYLAIITLDVATKTVKIRLNGVEADSGTVTGMLFNIFYFNTVARHFGASQNQLQAFMFEAVEDNKTWNAAQIAEVEAALKSEYGFTY